MGFLSLLRWLKDVASDTSPSAPVTDEVRALADGATGTGVTPEVLVSTDHSYRPLTTYVEEGEQPHFRFQGTELLIEDDTDSLVRNHPTRSLQVLVTDRRVVYVLGDRTTDNVLAVPLEDVVDVYVDDVDLHRYFIVEAYYDEEADTEEEPERDPRQPALAEKVLGTDGPESNPTFFANVTVDGRPEALDAAVEYVRDQTTVERPRRA